MKSQDILLLFKLAAIEQQVAQELENSCPPVPYRKYPWWDWENTEIDINNQLDINKEIDINNKLSYSDKRMALLASRLTIRGLAAETGISKSEVSQALKRNYFAGLAKPDRKSGLPKANFKALLEFVVHGLRYVFPVKPAELTRGIATGLAAPVLQGHIMTAGELAPVWPDANGKSKGQAIAPLFKSVPFAVRKDPQLYEYLALADAIRIGQTRERALASEFLEKILLRKY